MNAAYQREQSAKPKTIVLFSDGTGNSAAKQSKTNVWRLYQAINVATPSHDEIAGGAQRQIALYDNGVGTSSFKPVALLGGVFGYGLKRNVLDLYKFLCRNYEPGDHIYAFGFSRGAFTIRVLVGLIAQEGLVAYQGEEPLSKEVNVVFRQFRRSFKATKLAGGLRNCRDTLIDLYQRWQGDTQRADRIEVDQVRFVGVWDTVTAYGTPLAEFTRAIDHWIWPMSMPDYVLSEKVLQARHALALDDERDSFHPLLWDEVAERDVVKRANGALTKDRIKQVWFAGMHADVGGGYPISNLALVSLDWMMDEAAKSGLRFYPFEREAVARQKNELAPMHDSRAGLGSYYRYQPRKLSARLEEPDPTALALQDPSGTKAHGRLNEIVVHHSVVNRIRSSVERYAPITLPAHFKVRQPDNSLAPIELASGTEQTWNYVWRKRVSYISSLGVSALILALPIMAKLNGQTDTPCQGLQCLAASLASVVNGFLPSFMSHWTQSWAANPWVFLGLVGALAFTTYQGRHWQRLIHDEARDLWDKTLNVVADKKPGPPTQLQGADKVIFSLRTWEWYQKVMRSLKWRIAPAVIALCALVAMALAVIDYLYY